MASLPEHVWQHMQLVRDTTHSSAMHQPGAWGSPQVLSTHSPMHIHVHAQRVVQTCSVCVQTHACTLQLLWCVS